MRAPEAPREARPPLNSGAPAFVASEPRRGPFGPLVRAGTAASQAMVWGRASNSDRRGPAAP
eukprot:3329412-Alexandrium_andersonii.AAC.1